MATRVPHYYENSRIPTKMAADIDVSIFSYYRHLLLQNLKYIVPASRSKSVSYVNYKVLFEKEISKPANSFMYFRLSARNRVKTT